MNVYCLCRLIYNITAYSPAALRHALNRAGHLSREILMTRSMLWQLASV